MLAYGSVPGFINLPSEAIWAAAINAKESLGGGEAPGDPNSEDGCGLEIGTTIAIGYCPRRVLVPYPCCGGKELEPTNEGVPLPPAAAALPPGVPCGC